MWRCSLLNLSSVEAHEKTGKVKILAAATVNG